MLTTTIQVVDVAIEKVKMYFQMTVTYRTTFKGQPKVSAKKLTSVYTPTDMWELLEKAPKGAYFEIGYEKSQDGQFNNWVSAKSVDGEGADVPSASGQSSTPPSTTTKTVTNSTWAEKNELDAKRFEFEKVKQPLIIRQSCLSSAVELATSAEDAIAIAKLFEAYVLQKDAGGIGDLDSDVPF